jgi:hypothetical protein
MKRANEVAGVVLYSLKRSKPLVAKGVSSERLEASRFAIVG